MLKLLLEEISYVLYCIVNVTLNILYGYKSSFFYLIHPLRVLYYYKSVSNSYLNSCLLILLLDFNRNDITGSHKSSALYLITAYFNNFNSVGILYFK